jgi:O-antigen ligase
MNSKSNSSAASILAFGCFASALAFDPFVLDLTLTARYLALSLTLILVLFYWRKSNTSVFKADLFTLANLTFALFGFISIAWSYCASEAWFSSTKEIIACILLFCAIKILKDDPENFLEKFYKCCALLPLFGIAWSFYQMSEMKDWSKDSLYAISGINGHKNLFSAFLFLNSFFLILGFRTLRAGWKYISLISLVLSFGMIFFLRTKAVYGGIAAGLFVFAFVKYARAICGVLVKNKKDLFVSGLIILNIVVLYLLPLITQKALERNVENAIEEKAYTTNKELDNERLLLWDKSYSMFKKHPLLGVGAGNWQIFFPNEGLRGMWRAEDLNFTFQRPHNDVLWILSETGIVGLNLFFILCLSLGGIVLSSYEESKDEKIKFEILLSLCFLVGFLVLSLFDFPKERMEHLTWVTLIMAFAYSKSEIKRTIIFEGKFSSGARYVGITLLLLCLFIGIQRTRGEYYTRKMYDAKNSGYQAGVIENAVQAENYFYRVDPTTIPLTWYSGNAYVLQTNNEEANDRFLHAYETNPFNRNILNDLASSFSLKKDNALAEKYYKEAARISPRFDDVKLNLCAIYIQQQKFKEASLLLDSVFHDSQRRSDYRKMVNAFLGK